MEANKGDRKIVEYGFSLSHNMPAAYIPAYHMTIGRSSGSGDSQRNAPNKALQ